MRHQPNYQNDTLTVIRSNSCVNTLTYDVIWPYTDYNTTITTNNIKAIPPQTYQPGNCSITSRPGCYQGKPQAEPKSRRNALKWLNHQNIKGILYKNNQVHYSVLNTNMASVKWKILICGIRVVHGISSLAIKQSSSSKKNTKSKTCTG